MVPGTRQLTTSVAYASALISAQNLAALLLPKSVGESSCDVLDCSWYMPAAGRDPNAEFEKHRIPGARRFDFDRPGFALTDPAARGLPHMLPGPHDFQNTLAKVFPDLRLSPNRDLVLYSTNGFVGSARAWWMFRTFGHPRCRVLDGGLSAWEAAGFPVESNPVSVPANEATATETDTTDPPFQAVLNSDFVWDMSQVLDNTSTNATVLLDARPKGRFDATTPEPRAGAVAGHVPGSVSLQFADLIDPTTGRLKQTESIRGELVRRGVDLEASPRFAVTCGSGVTAPIISLALYELGFHNVPCYDGSWTEYSRPEHGNPIEPTPNPSANENA